VTRQAIRELDRRLRLSRIAIGDDYLFPREFGHREGSTLHCHTMNAVVLSWMQAVGLGGEWLSVSLPDDNQTFRPKNAIADIRFNGHALASRNGQAIDPIMGRRMPEAEYCATAFDLPVIVCDRLNGDELDEHLTSLREYFGDGESDSLYGEHARIWDPELLLSAVPRLTESPTLGAYG
jgi:hypothetical protein